jgi:ribonucleoside-diphosphate reductase alpha chain/ribonucleoside-triphosphate reductase
MTDDEEEALLVELRQVAHDSANSYADELGINRPLLSTTIKPEGTGTLVLGAGSSGLHFPKIRKGIRRIRVNAKDPIAQAVLKHEGWVVNPETDTEGDTHEERRQMRARMLSTSHCLPKPR